MPHTVGPVLATPAVMRQSGRYRGRSGHGVATANRSFMTHDVISAPQITAVRKVHSITSSARASNVGGTVRLSAIAVLRLMTI